MNISKKTSLLIWSCNIILFLLIAAVGLSSFFLISLPKYTDLDQNPEGSTKFSSKFSHNFLSDYFHFERTFDTEKNIDIENYYYASSKNLYALPLSDSLQTSVSKVNEELSSTETNLLELNVVKTIVSEENGSFPVLLASPAIPLSKERFNSLGQLNILSFILICLYAFIFFWFLRKFVTGLKEPDFFNAANSKNLYITAYLLIIAPFLTWIWSYWVRPDLYSGYLFEGAVQVNTTSTLPFTVLLFGMVLLVIAWCFEKGVELQTEQKLTV